MIRTLSIIALAAGLSTFTLGCEEDTEEHLEAAGESATGNVVEEANEAENALERAGQETEAELEQAGQNIEAEAGEAERQAEAAGENVEAEVAQEAQEEAYD